MLFNSYVFVFGFLPIALAGFYSLGRYGRGPGAVWLGLCSLAFYAAWNPVYVLLLLSSIAFNFGVSALIMASKAHPLCQKMWLIFGIAGDLGVLIYYKYLTALFSLMSGLGIAGLPTASIILPLGISFFTFTQIGYLVDVQQGGVKEHSPLNYVLFVTFFPHLIAGPILHHREVMPQFAQERTYRFSIENFTVGLMMFVIGLMKKCLLADPIASRVSGGFSASYHLTMTSAWLLILTYAVQLYFDFSGYTDMAIGIARMLNIRFPMNFNSPYKAVSIIDFWQRWHMTLTRLLTLYLFNPMALAVARRRLAHGLPIDKKAQANPRAFLTMTVVPLMITMGLAGIWHGAGFKFLVFGLLHGGYLTINHAWRMIRPKLTMAVGWIEHFAYWLLTLLAVLVALVFFRAPTMQAAFSTLGSMAGAHGLGLAVFPEVWRAGTQVLGMIFARHGAAASTGGVKVVEAAIQIGEIVALWFIVLFMPNSQQIMSRYEPVLGRVAPSRLKKLIWRPTPFWAVASGVAGALAVIAIAGTTDFVYFEF
ncbi:MAG: MBOAT family protein [Rhodospirillales bacterium]|nr:MBOAT family protein [Rhodospirillales bacterium]